MKPSKHQLNTNYKTIESPPGPVEYRHCTGACVVWLAKSLAKHRVFCKTRHPFSNTVWLRPVFALLHFALLWATFLKFYFTTWPGSKRTTRCKNIAEMLNPVPTVHGCYRQTDSRTDGFAITCSSSSVDQLDAGRRPLCPIHYVDPFLNQIRSNYKLINC